MIVLMLLILPYQISSQNQTNYISNGGFEKEIITTNKNSNRCPTNWTCNNIEVINSQYSSKMDGQFVDMELNGSFPGTLSQDINLSNPGACELTYYIKSSYGKKFNLTVFWNNVKVINQKESGKTEINFESFQINGSKGNNTLLFLQNGEKDSYGAFLDNISVSCNLTEPPPELSLSPVEPTPQASQVLQPTESTPQQQAPQQILSKDVSMTISVVSSLPTNAFLDIYLLTNDLWMYNYDLRNYTGILQRIFITAKEVEEMKFKVIGKYFDVSSWKKYFYFDDYLDFTDQNLFEKLGTSTIFLDANFEYFVFSVPQSIIISLMMYLIYMGTKEKCKVVSESVKTFYYAKTTIILTLLQPNISFFVYLCFSNMERFFSFSFFCKLQLIFTVLLFFTIIMFSFTFYFAVGYSLKKQSHHFNKGIKTCFYGSIFLTLRASCRSFFQGAIFYWLKHRYEMEVGMLGCLDLFLFFVTYKIHMKYSIVSSKISFLLHLLYHLFHTALNFTFLFESISERTQNIQINTALRKTQEIVLYILIAVNLFEIAFELAKPSIRKCRNFFKSRMEIKDEVRSIANREQPKEVQEKTMVLSMKSEVSEDASKQIKVQTKFETTMIKKTTKDKETKVEKRPPKPEKSAKKTLKAVKKESFSLTEQ